MPSVNSSKNPKEIPFWKHAGFRIHEHIIKICYYVMESHVVLEEVKLDHRKILYRQSSIQTRCNRYELKI